MSKYVLTLIVDDEQPGRARAKARADILDALEIRYGEHAGRSRLAERGLHATSWVVSEVVDP